MLTDLTSEVSELESILSSLRHNNKKLFQSSSPVKKRTTAPLPPKSAWALSGTPCTLLPHSKGDDADRGKNSLDVTRADRFVKTSSPSFTVMRTSSTSRKQTDHNNNRS